MFAELCPGVFGPSKPNELPMVTVNLSFSNFLEKPTSKSVFCSSDPVE